MTSAISIPYSVEDAATLIYCNSTMPTATAAYFPNVTHWMDGNGAMINYDTFHGEHSHPHIQHNPGHLIDGEIPVAIIDQMQHAQGQLEAEMNQQLNFYHGPEGSPSGSPGGHHHVFYPEALNPIVHAELSAGVCPPFQNHKPASKGKLRSLAISTLKLHS